MGRTLGIILWPNLERDAINWLVFETSHNNHIVKPEGCSSELIVYPGVCVLAVPAGVSSGEGREVEPLHVVGSQDHWQPLLVDDVLPLRYEESPRLLQTELRHEMRERETPHLEHSLWVPVTVERVELLGQPVVFPHPDSVEHSQPGLLVGARIS